MGASTQVALILVRYHQPTPRCQHEVQPSVAMIHAHFDLTISGSSRASGHNAGQPCRRIADDKLIAHLHIPAGENVAGHLVPSAVCPTGMKLDVASMLYSQLCTIVPSIRPASSQFDVTRSEQGSARRLSGQGRLIGVAHWERRWDPGSSHLQTPHLPTPFS